MTIATFRFYDRLNIFLPPLCRGREFPCAYARSATTKHMIEALGVPHTEVVLVLVNGEPAGFNRMLRAGDRVSVYPKFESLDVSELAAAPPRPPGPPRFVADSHLGALARLLRSAGFDTLFDNHYEDAALAELARLENRILLTRDRELLKRRTVLYGCYVHAVKPRSQLREVFDRFELAARMQPFTLCTYCNVSLREVDKQQVLDRLPPRVQELHDFFLTCDHCQRIYWEGSHWKQMSLLLQSLTDDD